MITECKSRFRDTSGDVIDSTAWMSYLNQAFRRVNERTPLWPWLEAAESTLSFVANQRSADLPAGAFGVNWVYNFTNDVPMYPDQPRGNQWMGNRQLRSTVGPPTTYKVRGNAGAAKDMGCLDVYPLPDASYSLRIEAIKFPAVLDCTTNCIAPFPTIFHTILVDGALALAYLDDGNTTQYETRMGAFNAAVTNMMIDLLQHRTQQNVVIADTFFS